MTNQAAADYEKKFLQSTHKGQIEQLKNRLLDVCDNHNADTGKSPLFMGWFIDTLEECTGSFDRFLNEIDAPAGSSSQNSYLEIIGAVNKLWADIAFNHSDERNTHKGTPQIGEV